MTSALARIRAERARRGLGLHDFIVDGWRWVDPVEGVFGRYTRTLCWVLEQVLKGRIRRLIINVPPGHMKSLTVSVFWPAWAWLMRPDIRFVFTAYRGDLALRDADRSRDLMRSEFYSATGHNIERPSEILLFPLKAPVGRRAMR